jgi:hypothetical protein
VEVLLCHRGIFTVTAGISVGMLSWITGSSSPPPPSELQGRRISSLYLLGSVPRTKRQHIPPLLRLPFHSNSPSFRRPPLLGRWVTVRLVTSAEICRVYPNLVRECEWFFSLALYYVQFISVGNVALQYDGAVG